MKRSLVLALFVVGGLLNSSCQRDIVCFGTAESVAFSLVDSTGAFILTEADTNTVAITYLDANNTSVVVPDVQISENVVPDLYSITSVEMVNLAHQDNSTFTLTYRDQVLGTITLDTYSDDTGCDPWYITSNLLFNGESVNRNPIGVYLIKVDL